MPTDAEGMEIVSRGRDAGSSEDEILGCWSWRGLRPRMRTVKSM